MHDWSATLYPWLSKAQLTQYFFFFKEAKMSTMQSVLHLDLHDLRSVGIRSEADMKRLLWGLCQAAVPPRRTSAYVSRTCSTSWQRAGTRLTWCRSACSANCVLQAPRLLSHVVSMLDLRSATRVMRVCRGERVQPALVPHGSPRVTDFPAR
jgi:hypothetical protein